MDEDYGVDRACWLRVVVDDQLEQLELNGERTGDVDCLGETADVTHRVDLGPDGPGGQVIDLTVRNGAGDLAVRRG